jgi:hypothetical protein
MSQNVSGLRLEDLEIKPTRADDIVVDTECLLPRISEVVFADYDI